MTLHRAAYGTLFGRYYSKAAINNYNCILYPFRSLSLLFLWAARNNKAQREQKPVHPHYISQTALRHYIYNIMYAREVFAGNNKQKLPILLPFHSTSSTHEQIFNAKRYITLHFASKRRQMPPKRR
jgi:hypothetical protein